MASDELIDRRQTARIPTGARLLYRAVGMRGYEVCELAQATTSAVEVLLDRPLGLGTVLTILIRPEEVSGRPYRLIGRVDRREVRGTRWLHVVKASNRRRWSPMYIYDVMCQVLNGQAKRAVAELMDLNTSAEDPRTRHPAVISGLQKDVSPRKLTEVYNTRLNSDVYRPGQSDTTSPSSRPFASFNQPDALLRKIIFSEAAIVGRPKGTTFVKCGAEDDISIYLVEGTLELEAFDGQKSYVEAGTQAAQLPISTLRPHAYTVTAATEVSVFLLSQTWVRNIVQIIGLRHNPWGIEVAEESFVPPTDSDA